MNQTIEKKKIVSNEILSWERNGNTFHFHGKKEVLELKVICDEIIKIRLAPNGFFLNDFSYAIQDYNFQIDKLSFEEHEDCFKIITSQIVCLVDRRSMKIRIEDLEGNIINEDEVGIHWEENIEFGGNYVYCSKKMAPDEHFFGLGDKPSDLNLKHKRYCNWGSDTYGYEKDRDPLYRNIPFYLGLNEGKGYGIFFDNSFKTYFDFGDEDPDVVSFWADGGEMNYYYIHGPELLDVVRKYSQLTGTHYLPPMWALGYHQCRWSYYPESTVYQLASTFREKKIPCDAIYLDIDYMDGFRCFTWNKSYFPDPEKMIADLKHQGFKTVVIIDPGIKIDDKYWVYREGLENGHFCRRGDGPLMEGVVWPGKCNFPDFTKSTVRDWWGGLFEEYVRIGVDGVWNDMNEPAVFGIDTFPGDVRHDYDGNPCSHRKAHNVYGMQMVRSTYEGLLRLQDKKRPFTITRSGYAGVQRFAAVWTGDNVATWEHLSIANVQCQRLSISGISFTGSDIGGFTGDSNGELFARWIQLGVFSPLFRTHSAGDTIDQEPWSYGEECENVVRKFIELRYQLLPYIYTSFWQCVTDGTPILRPLAFVDQHDKETYQKQDEFCFGDNILVCPIVEQGAKGRNCYLPRGKWYNYFTDEVIIGGTEVWVDAPLDQIPIFVKAGAIVPHYPVMQYVGEKEIEELTLHVYPDTGELTSVIYEDHGDNFAYEQEIYSLKKLLLCGEPGSFTITQNVEGKFSPEYKKYEFIIHGTDTNTLKATIDEGKEVNLEKGEGNIFKIKVEREFTKLKIDLE